MDQMKTGKFIAEKRKEKELTQAQLAAQLGVTDKAVSKWENGKCMPDISILQPLCRALDVSVTAMLEGEDEKSSENGGSKSDRSGEKDRADALVLKLLRVIKMLKQLIWAVVGLIICNIPYALEDIPAISGIEDGTFLRGFVNGSFAGLKIVGMAFFAYGIVMYIREHNNGTEK